MTQRIAGIVGPSLRSHSLQGQRNVKNLGGEVKKENLAGISPYVPISSGGSSLSLPSLGLGTICPKNGK